MTQKSLHDDHMVRVASRPRRPQHGLVSAMQRSGTRGWREEIAGPFIANQNWENWMKLVKASAIALALSAMVAGPVLAQGAASDTHVRGGAQGKTNMQGSGMSGSGDEEFDAQTGAAGGKAGAAAKSGTKGTVGAGSGAVKGSGDAATGGKR